MSLKGLCKSHIQIIVSEHTNYSIHAIGDRGIDVGLDAIESAQQKHPTEDMRHRIERHFMPPYPNIYIWEVFDERGKVMTRKLGWETNTRTRPLMIDTLSALIREEQIIFNSVSFIRESLGFVKNSLGKPEAAPGSHDDRVMAMAVAVMMHTSQYSGKPTSVSVNETEYDMSLGGKLFVAQQTGGKDVLMPEPPEDEESAEVL